MRKIGDTRRCDYCGSTTCYHTTQEFSDKGAWDASWGASFIPGIKDRWGQSGSSGSDTLVPQNFQYDEDLTAYDIQLYLDKAYVNRIVGNSSIETLCKSFVSKYTGSEFGGVSSEGVSGGFPSGVSEIARYIRDLESKEAVRHSVAVKAIRLLTRASEDSLPMPVSATPYSVRGAMLLEWRYGTKSVALLFRSDNSVWFETSCADGCSRLREIPEEWLDFSIRLLRGLR